MSPSSSLESPVVGSLYVGKMPQCYGWVVETWPGNTPDMLCCCMVRGVRGLLGVTE